jgi:hypothetical protein
MVKGIFVDLQADRNPVSFTGWRLVICGAIMDAVITQHQMIRPKPHGHQTRARKPFLLCG